MAAGRLWKLASWCSSATCGDHVPLMKWTGFFVYCDCAAQAHGQSVFSTGVHGLAFRRSNRHCDASIRAVAWDLRGERSPKTGNVVMQLHCTLVVESPKQR